MSEPCLIRISPCSGVITLLAICILSLATARAQQTVDATVHRNDGLIESVRIHSANSNGIMWSDKDTPNPQLMRHNEIATVDFPEPDLWEEGNDYFYKGEFTKAIAAFSRLAGNPRGNFHPTPGNYTSLARLRLIECFRETGNAGAIVKTAASLNGQALPKKERGRIAVISAWADLGNENWEQALTKAESIPANPIAPDRNDLGFIKAMALEKTGKPEEAIIAYGTAYTVDFGASRELAKRAVKNAILLLIDLEGKEREGELHALVHTYAKVYNQGNLWEDAPAIAVELLEKSLNLPEKEEAPAEEPPLEADSEMAKPEERTAAKTEAVKPAPKPAPKPPSKPAKKPNKNRKGKQPAPAPKPK
ncbi:MAG: hypothetical protein P1U86_08015 [Verrucomicrobiales bacterium]|nr:hypothetical protein [Verrucomicrobiales bacterium]